MPLSPDSSLRTMMWFVNLLCYFSGAGCLVKSSSSPALLRGCCPQLAAGGVEGAVLGWCPWASCTGTAFWWVWGSWGQTVLAASSVLVTFAGRAEQWLADNVPGNCGVTWEAPCRVWLRESAVCCALAKRNNWQKCMPQRYFHFSLFILLTVAWAADVAGSLLQTATSFGKAGVIPGGHQEVPLKPGGREECLRKYEKLTGVKSSLPAIRKPCK